MKHIYDLNEHLRQFDDWGDVESAMSLMDAAAEEIERQDGVITQLQHKQLLAGVQTHLLEEECKRRGMTLA